MATTIPSPRRVMVLLTSSPGPPEGGPYDLFRRSISTIYFDDLFRRVLVPPQRPGIAVVDTRHVHPAIAVDVGGDAAVGRDPGIEHHPLPRLTGGVGRLVVEDARLHAS